MKAVVIRAPGAPEVLAIEEVPTPVHGPDEVLVRVRATALNRADLLQRRGRYPAPAGSSQNIPGLEFAGEVERAGDRVRGLQPGDRVMGLLGGGGYAEYVAVHEGLCMRIPPSMSWTDAAAIPEAFVTAYDALFLQGGLAAGEVVLLHAAASGVGTAAAQLAELTGARAIGLSRTADKRRRLAAVGLFRALDPTSDDLAASVHDATSGRGVDLVLDLVGGPALASNLELLAASGRLVVVGLLGGARGELDLARLMTRRLTLTGTVLRSRPVEEKIALVRKFARRLLSPFAAGRLHPVVDRVLPFSEAPAAHALMERNENFGKIVLELP